MRPACAILLALLLSGCGNPGPGSLEAFKQAWHRAVNDNEIERLYGLLDTASQQRIAEQLHRLRGYDAATQQRVIDQLGGARIGSLDALSEAEYFARLWHQATAGRRPTMSIDSSGEDWAYMTLSLGEGRVQQVRLTVEARRWVWQLPPQTFTPPEAGPLEGDVPDASTAPSEPGPVGDAATSAADPPGASRDTAVSGA